ncbi:unnamed protein product [Musa hybrid cultivar]
MIDMWSETDIQGRIHQTIRIMFSVSMHMITSTFTIHIRSHEFVMSAFSSMLSSSLLRDHHSENGAYFNPRLHIEILLMQDFIDVKETLAAAFGGSSTRVQLLVSVSEAINISEIQRLIDPVHPISLCLLVASVLRCLGLWHLREVRIGPLSLSS